MSDEIIQKHPTSGIKHPTQISNFAPMTLDEFRLAYQNADIIREIASELEEDCPKISLKGLAGSSKAVACDAITQLTKGYHLFILRDK